MRPAAALFDAIIIGRCWSPSLRRRPYYGRPGEVIEKLQPDVRAALRELTSASASDVREETLRWLIEPVSVGDRVARQW